MSLSGLPRWQRRLLVPLLGLLAANLVLLAFYTRPRLAEERDSAQRLASLREVVSQQRVRTEALRERAEVARANEQELKRFYSEVVCPDERARFELAESLEEDFAQAGVQVARRAWSSEPLRTLPLEHVTATLPTRGSYAQLRRLLDRLERAPSFLIVEQVDLRQSAGQPAALDVTISTYCRQGAGT
jgi:hypothetical protein